MHCNNAEGQWAMKLVQCIAALSRGSGRCYSRNAPRHCLGAVGGATAAMHCLTALGEWAGQLPKRIASLRP